MDTLIRILLHRIYLLRNNRVNGYIHKAMLLLNRSAQNQRDEPLPDHGQSQRLLHQTQLLSWSVCWRIAFLLGFFIVRSGFGKSQKLNGILPKTPPYATTNPKPILFATGQISTEDDEFGATFTPDGKTCYFTKKTPSTLSSSMVVICVSRLKAGHWSTPEIAPFSGRYKDFNPSISPDGSSLFFISNRPTGDKKRRDTDIWMVRKSGDGWTQPENIGAPVNTPGFELGCSVSSDGTLYFSSTGTTGNLDLYCSKWVKGAYQKPDSLGAAINTVYAETTPFIAPDESYILFSSQGRPDALVGPGASVSYPRSDLYISFRQNGQWTTAQNVGLPVNSDADEASPWVSSDGQTLYFTSERNFVRIPMKQKLTYSALTQSLHRPANGLGDIYQIPARKILAPGQREKAK